MKHSILANVVSGLALETVNRQCISKTGNANLTISSVKSITKNREISFRTAIQGITSASLDQITCGASAAMFTAYAATNTPVIVTFSAADRTGGTQTISFAGPGAHSGGRLNHQCGSTSVTSAGTSAAGAYIFFAGGTAPHSPTQSLGVYSDIFTPVPQD